jgi:hypothetical protein
MAATLSPGKVTQARTDNMLEAMFNEINRSACNCQVMGEAQKKLQRSRTTEMGLGRNLNSWPDAKKNLSALGFSSDSQSAR